MRKFTCQMSANEFMKYLRDRMETWDDFADETDSALKADVLEWFLYHPKGKPVVKVGSSQERAFGCRL